MEPPWEGGTKVFINGPGHMTRIVAMPIYGKNLLKKFCYRTNSPMTMQLGMEHYVLKLYKVFMNDEPEYTLTYFTTIKFGES